MLYFVSTKINNKPGQKKIAIYFSPKPELKCSFEPDGVTQSLQLKKGSLLLQHCMHVLCWSSDASNNSKLATVLGLHSGQLIVCEPCNLHTISQLLQMSCLDGPLLSLQLYFYAEN